MTMHETCICPACTTSGKTARPGDDVTLVFRGVYDGYDSENGHHKVRGSFDTADGTGHVEWTIEAHWAADLNAAQKLSEAKFACDTHMCGQCKGCRAAKVRDFVAEAQRAVAAIEARIDKVVDLLRDDAQVLLDSGVGDIATGMVAGISTSTGALLGEFTLHGPGCATCAEGGPKSREFHRSRSDHPNPLRKAAR